MNLLLCLLSGILLILVFPRFDAVWLAPVALVPMLIASTRESRPLHRFLMSWAAGIVYWFGVCYWIQAVLDEHGGLPTAGSWAVFALFCLAKGLHMAVFGTAAGYFMAQKWAAPAIAALWTGIERTHGPLGFAWLNLGNAGINMGLPMRLAPLTGVYGLSFVFALMNVCVALVALRRPRREILWLVALPFMFLLPGLPEARPGDRTAIVVQPNLSTEGDWTTASAENLRQRLVDLSLRAAMQAGSPRADIILWPEMPAPLYFESDPKFRNQVTTLARATATPVLFGNVAFTKEGRPLNSATMVDPAGEFVDRYDKINLVPFGEFVPPLFGFVDKISSEAGDFQAGNRIVVFRSGQHRVAAFICYESVFPHQVRQFTLSGAELLANLSNDGYFARSASREQHLSIVRMRAAENRRWIIRATNDGITAAIDPAGRLVDRLEPYRELVSRVRFEYRSDITAYVQLGDWFAWSCLAASALLLAREFAWYRLKR